MKPTDESGSMKIIGITGGVGAGKSTVLQFLAGLPGVRVEEADRAGHLVMEPGTEAFRKIREHFGTGILGKDGRIDRPVLSRIVFSDRRVLSLLDRVVNLAREEWVGRGGEQGRS